MNKISLRPITLSDTELIVRWRNTDAVRLNMYDQRILTPEQHRYYYHSFIEKGVIVQYIIEMDKKAIGTIFYKKRNDKSVEIGLFLGEEDYYGRGVGKYVLNKLLSIIEKRGYGKMILKVKRDNNRAFNLYLHSGFVVDDYSKTFIEMSKTNNYL